MSPVATSSPSTGLTVACREVLGGGSINCECVANVNYAKDRDVVTGFGCRYPKRGGLKVPL
jgi:hypothetical protein